MPVEVVARAVVDGFEDTGNDVRNFEELGDRFIEQWVSGLEPAARLAALMALDRIYTNDLVSVLLAADRFIVYMIDTFAEVIRLIGEHLSYVKVSSGGPDTSFDEKFAAELAALIDSPMTARANDLSSKARQLVDLQRTAESEESHK